MKRVQLFLVSIALLSNFGAFANDNPANAGDGTPKTRKEIEAALTNYRISCVIENKGQPAFHFFQASCAQGWAVTITTDDKDLLVIDEAGKKVYMLDRNAKTGKSGPYDPELADDYRGINLAYLFIHISSLNDSKFKRTGRTETIAGRKTTVYMFKFNEDAEATFWIDNEYGCTLKYVQTIKGAQDMHAEVTEFKVGGVTVANMVNLSEYKITEAKEN